MLEIAESDLPFVRTRSALLALDLQSDFLGEECILPVHHPPNLIENIVNLATQFRPSGDVIWFRSQFQASRTINSRTDPDSENVITDNELPTSSHASKGKRGSSPLKKSDVRRLAKDIGADSGVEGNNTSEAKELPHEIQETFLTLEPGKKAEIVLQHSPSSNFARSILTKVDSTRDLIFQKFHYSAFKDGSLVQTLRGRFVTELYICGSFTNIGVFATAMDAARHGYSITLVDDCCGYRSRARHDEAIRRLADFTGCETISSHDLIKGIQEKERTRAKAQTKKPNASRQPQPRNASSTLESMMKKLEIDQGEDDEKTELDSSISSTLARIRSQMRKTSPVSATSLESDGGLGNSPDASTPSRSSSGVSKRDRIPSKIKTRRRLSNTSKAGPREGEAAPSTSTPASKSDVQSSSKSTLETATQALENMTMSGRRQHSTADNQKPPHSDIAKPSKSNGDEDRVHIVDKKASLSTEDLDTLEPASSYKREQIETMEVLCEGDTTIIKELLPEDLVEGIFERIRDEVLWRKMSHQGGEVPRLVSVQGEIEEDGTIPIYRHPADESPPLSLFTPTVSQIKEQVERRLGHKVNHVLIQFYRSGSDHITEHSDKTLDIVPGTFIANVSLGAQRTMVFRTKRPPKGLETVDSPPRKTCRAALPHNSMCRMGLRTNMHWLHGIRPDKRMVNEKTEKELAYGGERISLTFRQIGTFLGKHQQKIWGQGAVAKTKSSAQNVINGRTPEAEEMLIAFGTENQSSHFDWQASYGVGFDVLHLSNEQKLVLSGDFVTDTRVKFMLAELGIDWTEGSVSPAFYWKDGNAQNDVPEVPASLPIKFVDNDSRRSVVEGDMAILMYLSTAYDRTPVHAKTRDFDARAFTRFFATETLLQKWRETPFLVKSFRKELTLWDTWAKESKFIAGDYLTIADFALWPVLAEIGKEWSNCQGLDHLNAYFLDLQASDSLKKATKEALDSRVSTTTCSTQNEQEGTLKEEHSQERAEKPATVKS